MSREGECFVSMIPDLFCAKLDKERGTVVLTSRFGKFTLVGSSNITSARAGDVVSSLTIVPLRESRGVVAVAVHDPGKGRCDGEWYAYLLEVSYRGDDPWVDLETPFVCDENRVGHVHRERFIEITMDYQWYSSCPNTGNRKHIEVPDDDLLCCWIAGTIGDDEVIAAAKKYEAEQTELEQLREEVKKMTGISTMLQTQLEAERSKVQKWHNAYSEQSGALSKATQTLFAIKTALCGWFPRTAARRMIEEYYR